MMGNLFSRNKSPATELERVALTIDELKRRLQTINSSNSTTLSNYYLSIILILSIAIAHTCLRYEEPTRSYMTGAFAVGALVVIFAGRYVINAIYAWRINRTTQKLEDAFSQKATLLDLVKETLKFKEAKEILDRYEKGEQQEKPSPKEVVQPIAPLQKPETPATPKQEAKGTSAPQAAEQQFKANSAMSQQGMSPYNQRHPNAVPVRPFLRQTTALDRVLDYFMSDGPNCRNALICSICHTHNGMAMPAEYPYIAFRCFECGHMNPPKKGPQGPLTRPPNGPKGIQHNGRVAPPQNNNNANPIVKSEEPKVEEKKADESDSDAKKEDVVE